jgi:hypothetical protein
LPTGLAELSPEDLAAWEGDPQDPLRKYDRPGAPKKR